MEWLYILMPISGVNIFWPGLIILGFGGRRLGQLLDAEVARRIHHGGVADLGLPRHVAVARRRFRSGEFVAQWNAGTDG